ncbi:hypothetical protein N9O66_00405 [Alphaproteobacteria bacterium]|jgi:hypothetical protein|nr:hypothetical protein [Alphaproteobacteria bacterium]MDA9807482.1 hypothetical protein [Alphaproteobacteria bacterium]MDC0968910.1 hypothetical protein [Alphaproteobacteria bacterium]
MLKKLNLQNNNQEKILFNNINDYVIKIDYYDDKGSKKKKYNVPLKYILNNSYHMSNKPEFCVN